MKSKTVKIIILSLLIIASTGIIHAQSIGIGNSTFTIPDEYIISENNTHHVKMSDENTSINIYTGDNACLEDIEKKIAEDNEKLLEESTYIIDGIEVSQQKYVRLDQNTILYSFRKKNTPYIIAVDMESYMPIPEKKDNPVNKIIRSLE